MPASASCSELQRPQAIVFDVDGTLVDTLPAVHAALGRVLADAGLAPMALDQVRQHFSAGMAGLLTSALAQAGAAGDAALQQRVAGQFTPHYLNCVADLARPYAGVDTLLRTLQARGYPLALCSNGAGDALQRMLGHFGWQRLFSAVVDAGNARALKPSAAPLLQVLRPLQVAPAQAWLVGDSALDAQCARAAGSPFVWVASGYGDAAVGVDALARLASPPALLALAP